MEGLMISVQSTRKGNILERSQSYSDIIVKNYSKNTYINQRLNTSKDNRPKDFNILQF